MRRKIVQIGVLTLSNTELQTLLNIFSAFPDYLMLAKSYIAIKRQVGNTLITDDMILELIKKMKSGDTKAEEAELIDKILEFRSNATITIE